MILSFIDIVCIHTYVYCTNNVGEDWMSAMKKKMSPLHLLNPTGFEIQLYTSIVKDDAYLPRFAKP